ncbi:MAG: acyl-CoA desaturase, partial [Nocardioides sp.]|nr:acyl-CoA desaturase [Nocardioides sp.]
RYPEIAEDVREICERYGIDYNTGPLGRQLGSVAKKICRYALPDSPSDLKALVPGFLRRRLAA